MKDFTHVVLLSNYRKQFHYPNCRKQLMGLWEKHSPTNSNTHLGKFSIHLSTVFTRLMLKKTHQIHIWPLKSKHTKNWSLFIIWLMTRCPKSAKGSYSLFFNHSSTIFLLQKGKAEISQKGFLRRLAWISGSVPVDSRWIGLYQWSAQRSSQNRPQPDCPTLAQACPCISPGQDKIKNHKREFCKKKKRKE